MYKCRNGIRFVFAILLLLLLLLYWCGIFYDILFVSGDHFLSNKNTSCSFHIILDWGRDAVLLVTLLSTHEIPQVKDHSNALFRVILIKMNMLS